MDAAHTADEIFLIAPALDGQNAAMRGKGEILGSYGDRVISRFEEHGLPAGFEKRGDGSEGALRIGFSARGLH